MKRQKVWKKEIRIEEAQIVNAGRCWGNTCCGGSESRSEHGQWAGEQHESDGGVWAVREGLTELLIERGEPIRKQVLRKHACHTINTSFILTSFHFLPLSNHLTINPPQSFVSTYHLPYLVLPPSFSLKEGHAPKWYTIFDKMLVCIAFYFKLLGDTHYPFGNVTTINELLYSVLGSTLLPGWCFSELPQATQKLSYYKCIPTWFTNLLWLS